MKDDFFRKGFDSNYTTGRLYKGVKITAKAPSQLTPHQISHKGVFYHLQLVRIHNTDLETIKTQKQKNTSTKNMKTLNGRPNEKQ